MNYQLWLVKKGRNLPSTISCALLKTNVNDSISFWLALARKFPREYTPQSKLYFLYMRADQTIKGLRHWEKMNKKFTKYSHHHFMRAMWEMKGQNYKEAIKHVKSCLRVDNGFYKYPANFWLAICCYELGYIEQSKIALQKVSLSYSEIGNKKYRGKGKRDLLNMINNT